MDVKKRIALLREELHNHNYRYYILDSPLISDYDFDMKMKELETLEKAHPEYDDPNSPIRRVGGGITKSFDTVTHRHRMYSLDNSYSLDELEQWERRMQKNLGGVPLTFTCEPKYDGVSITITYKSGDLLCAVTRGDGFQGDDITTNVRTIKSVPLKLMGEDVPDILEVRGEIVLPISVFKALNDARIKAGDTPYMNPRNTASGTLKLQDSREVAKRKLDAIMYTVVGNTTIRTQMQVLENLKKWGFKVPQNVCVHTGIKSVFETVKTLENKRSDLPYEIDGSVVKCNELDYQSELGYTSKSPRWAIAYKFKTDRVKTVLESISYQVGRTGAITPVANLKPIRLGGTTVKRASLYNADQIEKLNLYYGDTVYVEKGGEIIPKIVAIDESTRKSNAEKVTYVKFCPQCDSLLVKNPEEVNHFCENVKNCPPQIKGRIEHFISRKAMDISGIGSETVSMLVDCRFIDNYSDLYDLKKERIIGLEGMADKSADNLIIGVQESKSIPYYRVLYALGIRHVGETVAGKLAKSFPSVDMLKSASIEELVLVDDVGMHIAKSVVAFFSNPDNLQIVEKLRSIGLQFSQENGNYSRISDIFLGKIFVVSGVFSMSRDDIKSMITDRGGIIGSSISSKTHFLLAGERMGVSKKQKAEKLEIPIISEHKFLEMLKK